jgi:A/G-specific adenine glycosylase
MPSPTRSELLATGRLPADPVAAELGKLLAFYAEHHRDLPWRQPDATPWGVLVSEVMLQQTPVNRVLPAWAAWMQRWPTPAALAAASAADAVRQWDRLGYPRRAMRLHQAATDIVEQHHGQVPAGVPELLALPGIGSYTARAVAAFAFGQRVPVVDTNVTRVISRWRHGEDGNRSATPADLARADALLPNTDAPLVSVALMELGALVCTARSPQCPSCPFAASCQWLAAGKPPGAPRRGQGYAGTDRQVRGRLLALLRASPDPLTGRALDAAWDEPVQRERALASLVADGLVVMAKDSYALPGDHT